MALDPQIEALITGLEQQGRPALYELGVPRARDVTLALRGVQGEPEPVAGVRDLLVPGPAGDLPVRVYTPEEGDAPRPMLVFFHGGGWVIANVEVSDAPCRSLANASGCIVASVEYRLAPESKYPAAAEDCYAATSWLAEHASELGADPRRIGVVGDSAGGNLAAVTALMARDRGGPELACQLLVYPVTAPARGSTFGSYAENAEGFFLSRDTMEWFWGLYTRGPADDVDPYAAPLHAADHGRLPPAFIATCEYDPLRDEGEAYAERLRAAGVEATVSRYDGCPHGLFWLGGIADRAKELIEEVGTRARKALGA